LRRLQLRKLLLLSYEWVLRTLFSFVLLLSAVAFVLILIDFSLLDEKLSVLDRVKKRPEAVRKGLWVGGYFTDEDFIRFLRKANIKVVISMLDLDMIHERRLYHREKEILRRLNIILINIPTKPILDDSGKISNVVKVAKEWRNRGFNVYIHSYLGRFRIKKVKEVLGGRKNSSAGIYSGVHSLSV
jgi:hypothetical protein